jgi:hypothetical protein
MSVMSAAEAGEPAGTSPEIFPRGPRMAGPATDQDGADPNASSPGECPEEAGPSSPGRNERRLRLVATELRVREVRVAREVSTRTLRVGSPGLRTQRGGAPRAGAQPAYDPGVSEQRAGGPRVSAERVTVQRASMQRATAQRAGTPGAGVPGAGVPGAGVPAVGVQRVRVQRVRVQRASARRVGVQGASVQPGGLRLTRRGRRVVTGFAMLVAVIGAMLIWTSVAGGAQAPSPGAPARSAYQGMTQIVVQPGQTLWSVAATADPSAQPWTVIQQISDANALNGTQIQAGQLLWVPKG